MATPSGELFFTEKYGVSVLRGAPAPKQMPSHSTRHLSGPQAVRRMHPTANHADK